MTAKKKYDNEKKVVKWIMFDGKNCLKFDDDDKMYSLADNVLNEDKTALKYGEVANGDNVEVGINDDEVVFIKKIEVIETKEETKNDNKDAKELTVEGKPKQGFSILFQEDKDNWHQVNPKCQKFVSSLNKGDKVKVTFGKFQATSKEGKKYPKDGVIFIEKITGNNLPQTDGTTGSTKTTESNGTKPYNSTNNSIERQVALKGAIEIVKILLEKDMLDKGKIKEALVDLTKNCFDSMKI